MTLSCLVTQDESIYMGTSFGAERCISGECVFQTGMVGYPESLTDPSYEGQILVLTFPLIGNYGVPSRTELDSLLNLPKYFESNRIHISGLIVGIYSHHYSHYLASSSLSDWLKENNVPAIYGLDTRALTKKIRDQGSMLAKILFPKTSDLVLSPLKPLSSSELQEYFQNVDWVDPNAVNLVQKVSRKSPQLFSPDPKTALYTPSGRIIRILALDVGMKNNQIRCFVSRGVECLVVPFDYDFVNTKEHFDGLFISNGPGDPEMCTATISNLKIQLKKQNKPIFGICLGHQILALAAGAKTRKLKFGNRGHNIPCTNLQTGRCFITSQNHGFAVDVETLPLGWKEYFVNANDGSNEGIIHSELPYFSVQFHPESTPGPWDTEFLFDKFIGIVDSCVKASALTCITPDGAVPESKRVYMRKVLLLGSGGLSIGQAGEFDYSGSQAIKALKEENIYTILINPNIATIQTSKGLADKVYFLPVTPEYVRQVIQHEKPDGIYCTFGGQTALNVGVKMKDEFEALGVTVLGTPIETIEITEDRELFAQHMAQIGEKCATSCSATSLQEALAAGSKIGYPVIVRAAYALGGLGSGFAENELQLKELCTKAFATSPQVLVERSMKGWKEIEYEVVRDAYDNCITVCNMENFDPLGIHTGDSIVVAPSQTLSDEDYMMLRRTAVNVIRHLGVIGECNIQYALNPTSKEYCIIEVNARLSRSSALASKATGYPLAFVAAKLGLNIPLTQVKNSVTKKTIACFEPSLDYVVVKMPRWDLKKFNRVSTKISSSMKSVGEVMAIGKTFEETIQKAIRAVEYSFMGFSQMSDLNYTHLDEELANPSDQRLFAIANALHSGYTVDRIWELTRIDKWFLLNLKRIVDYEVYMRGLSCQSLSIRDVWEAKKLGFSDRQIAKVLSTTELAIRKIRKEMGVIPFVKQIDTVAAEFPCFTNYLYRTYHASEHDVDFKDQGVMVLGSGVYRIGSSVEFDWCAVRCIRTLRSNGFKTIMVNYNPETVSTDYDEADRLYFETLTLETILDIYEIEGSAGVVVSMGGQTPNNIALPLYRENVKILGTCPEMIDGAENRYKFSRMLDKIGVDQPQWKELTCNEEASAFCNKVGYPVLVRPSYVLSGAAMNVVYTENDLVNYLAMAVKVSREYPVVISKFIEDAKEIEMDAVSINGETICSVVSEHIENAGVHSGDATLVLPPQDLDPETVYKIKEATRKIGAALNVTGPFNIQFIAKNNEIKVIECNVRASRSFPFVSKVLGVDLIELATRAIMGLDVEPVEIHVPTQYVGVKVPQFSFSRLSGADPVLGVEMASTGEVACFGKDKFEAYLKALIATGFQIPKKNILLSMGSFKEKMEFLPFVVKLHQMGFNLFATSGTADFIQEHSIPVQVLEAFEEDSDGKLEYSLTQHLANNLIDLYINLPSKNRYRRPASYMSRGYRTRRMAVDFDIPLITNIKCAKLFIEALSRRTEFEISSNDYKTSHTILTLPGLISIGTLLPNSVVGNNMETLSKVLISSGFTFAHVMPCGTLESIVDKNSIESLGKAIANHSWIDFTLSIAGTRSNSKTLESLLSQVESIFINFDINFASPVSNLNELNLIVSGLANTVNGRIITNAKGAELVSVLFFANLGNIPLHVSCVSTCQDLELIEMSKEKGMNVTLDVCLFNLFFSKEDYDSPHLSDAEDVLGLWSKFQVIDVLSVGPIPSLIAKSAGVQGPEIGYGIDSSLPLLISAMQQGKLTLQNIIDKMVVNPREIFGLVEQSDTFVEVEIDRPFVSSFTLTGTTSTIASTSTTNTETQETKKQGDWTLIKDKSLSGSIHRVVVNGTTVYLDGFFFGNKNGSLLVGKSAPVSRRKSSLKSPQVTSMAMESSIVRDPRNASPRRSRLASVDSPLVSLREYSSFKESVSFKEQGKEHVKEQEQTPTLSDYIPRSLTSHSPFYRKHVLSVQQFTRSDLHLLFNLAQELRTLVERQGICKILSGKVLCCAFWEPSTRTNCSFETAMLRLGGQVIHVNSITSSIAKGESIGDTLRSLSCYADAIVMRHPQHSSVSVGSKYATVPVINAGDGIGEHPTQALLDIFTIREELGTVNGLTITMVGDLKHGRTVHSLVKLLSHYQVKINYVSPESLRLPLEIQQEAQRAGISQFVTSDLNQVIGNTDVLYVTRIQKERFESLQEYDKVKDSFTITNKVLQDAKSHMIVMHPLPRINEIDEAVDFDQRAAYFRQMKYGLYVRMALLALVLGCSF